MESYDDDGYQNYDGYDDRWGEGNRRSPSGQRQKRGYGGDDQYGDFQGYGDDGRSSPGAGRYDSPPDPYASPPEDSSEDEFAETLYSLVGDELMDPNVSAAEKEVGVTSINMLLVQCMLVFR